METTVGYRLTEYISRQVSDMKKQKQVYRIDENGIYQETVIVVGKEDEDGNIVWDIPEDCIDVRMPDGLYEPIQWTGSEWVSLKTPEEIEELKNQQNPISQEEKIESLKKECEMIALAVMELSSYLLGGE